MLDGFLSRTLHHVMGPLHALEVPAKSFMRILVVPRMIPPLERRIVTYWKELLIP